MSDEWLAPLDGCPLVTYKGTSDIAIYTGYHTSDMIASTGKRITDSSTKLSSEHIDEEAYLFYAAVSPSIYILEETPEQKANYRWFNGYLRKVKRNDYRKKVRQRRHYIHSQVGYRNGKHQRTTQDFFPAPEFYNSDVDLSQCTCCSFTCNVCDHAYPISDWESEDEYTSDKDVLTSGFITDREPTPGQKSAHSLLSKV